MRCFGMLLPVYELPGRHGIGDFGPSAYRFADMLEQAGARIWQILPLNPVGYGNSPYQPLSSAAGETLYISLELLYRQGLLKHRPEDFNKDADRVDYTAVRAFKTPYFHEAALNFKKTDAYRTAFRRFAKAPWVRSYAVFAVLHEKNGGRPWMEWPARERDWPANKDADLSALEEKIEEEMILQFLFAGQWKALKDYANAHGIRIMGDMPFYVGQDSADVWEHRDKFLLDPDGFALQVAGVPPDYFSEDGQLWGNPIFDWKALEEDGFELYVDRIKACAKLYDILRIDHFRAFDTYWSIPAEAPTAATGEWILGPAHRFFDVLLPQVKKLKIVAEDLGDMRPEVYELRDYYDFPGMAVMEFLLADPELPKKAKKNMIAYTGTHDNDTVIHWWQELTDEERAENREALEKAGYRPTARTVARDLCRFVLNLKTDTAILPVQDILSLPGEARINEP
ncbi:MAG: 4-alpha-glucanotransferase, partial [Lachnospiraceae bacterium]|nr:4-alpha-glucanotransferase [Lachnospiraceae bacterium]